ncbi:hypothetical protein LTR99_011252 [Exophiala xenobiotica]|uniref:Ankyrin repeat protein n=1 Tax=Vermiconidia calcicola TaxID=1690605 RepID=A0AAV9PPW4_9PEZI|nr:hypothetical protein LTR99_011252 [Exophiala xenobiotica]KAK5425354.1 hypothetical protein LTR34_011194 [Exophiala xenobiotica]KAK5527424.1 hypothetical protein LTR25_011210 [Vermiconidia calcicola]KAK5527858.1 hypothetical protein LTR23_011170 [Chaetothyriales sp. CCFEE 6169]
MARIGVPAVVEKIKGPNVDVNAKGGHYGNALQAASFWSHEKIVQILIDAKADVNAQGGHYGNALCAASFNGHDSIVQKLLNAGADGNSVTYSSASSLI